MASSTTASRLAIAESLKNHGMGWWLMVLAGVCTPKFAIEAYVSQLNNLTLVAILLAGFAISFAVSPPEFPDDDTEIPRGVSKILTHLYGGGMLFSGMNCFAATSIALHAVNRLGNACPSKSSTAYMTIKVFFPARKAVQTYIFRGILGMVVGLVAAFVQSFNLFHGHPSGARIHRALLLVRRSLQSLG